MAFVALIPLILSSAPTKAGGAQEATAKRLFASSEKKLKAAKSLSCTLVGSGSAAYRIELLMQKPMSFRQIGTSVDIYCDGKTQVNHIVADKTYFRTDASKPGFLPETCCLESFFGYQTGALAPYFTESTVYSMVRIDGRKCAAKRTVFRSFGRGDYIVYYTDAQTTLPIGFDQDFGGTKMQFRIKNLRLNRPIPASSFTWNPPPGVQEKTIATSRRR